jgi:hypothetical protein
MRFVEEREVVAEWLSMELAKESKQAVELGEPEVREPYRELVQLLVQKPNCGQLFVDHELQWCATTLTQGQFRRLRSIWGDERLVMEHARAIRDGTSKLEAGRRARIRELADGPAEAIGRLILNRRKRPCSGPFVQDGNHRAVAIALRMVRGDEYPGTDAYVGYPSLDSYGWSGRARAAWHAFRGTL